MPATKEEMATATNDAVVATDNEESAEDEVEKEAEEEEEEVEKVPVASEPHWFYDNSNKCVKAEIALIQPLKVSRKVVNRLKRLDPSVLDKKKQTSFKRAVRLEGQLFRARLEVVHVERAENELNGVVEPLGTGASKKTSGGEGKKRKRAAAATTDESSSGEKEDDETKTKVAKPAKKKTKKADTASTAKKETDAEETTTEVDEEVVVEKKPAPPKPVQGRMMWKVYLMNLWR